MPPPSADLVGRDDALRAVDELLDGVEQRGGALLVRGEPGIGKSEVLLRARGDAAARGLMVLEAVGVPTEAQVVFAGLHQLLAPLLGRTDGLTGDERDALLGAFGAAGNGEPAQRFRVALAALALLGEHAARQPVVLLADDMQWVDDASADVLAFLAHRVAHDRIVLIGALRDGWESPLNHAGLAEVVLERLGPAEAVALLDRFAPGLAADPRERVLAAAAGNPLALVELPRVVAEGRDVAPAEAWVPLTQRLERAFAHRARDLPAGTRRLLLVAALHDADDVGEVLAAARRLDAGVTLEDLTPAVGARLLDGGSSPLRFRHPLVRAGVVQDATVSERHAAHRALAEVLASDPDRAVWHRAASVLGSDPTLAAELDAHAGRSAGRGGFEAASDALERAAALTADPKERGGRLLRAAGLALELGRGSRAHELLTAADAVELGPVDAARRALLHETATPSRLGDDAAVRALVDHADRVRADAPDLALDLLWAAANSSFWSDRGPVMGLRVLASLDAVGAPADDPQALSIRVYASSIDQPTPVAEVLQAHADRHLTDPRAVGLLANAAVTSGALAAAGPLLDAAVDGLRAEGRLAPLAQALMLRGWAAIHLGRWDIARADAAEGVQLARETGQDIWRAAGHVFEATLAGLRGDATAADAAGAEAERIGLDLGAAALLDVLQFARGITALSVGRYAEAYEHLARTFDPADPAHHSVESCWGIGHLAEAALHCGREDDARAVLARLEPAAVTSTSPWFGVAIRHARALLAPAEQGEAQFAEALTADLSDWPLDWARLQLAHGSWLRRRRRVTESRVPLRTARDAFDALGAGGWAERARQELRSVGETSQPRRRPPADQLTPQELQIIRLASQGLTNRQIGERLFLSHRTVGSHLYRAFPKLGITSRAQITAALERDGP